MLIKFFYEDCKMAVSETRSKDYQFQRKIFSDSPPTFSYQLQEKILKVDFETLRPIARRQIANYMRQYRFHPQRSIYLYYINLVILHEKLFRNLNYKHLIPKKSDLLNE